MLRGHYVYVPHMKRRYDYSIPLDYNFLISMYFRNTHGFAIGIFLSVTATTRQTGQPNERIFRRAHLTLLFEFPVYTTVPNTVPALHWPRHSGLPVAAGILVYGKLCVPSKMPRILAVSTTLTAGMVVAFTYSPHKLHRSPELNIFLRFLDRAKLFIRFESKMVLGGNKS